jgi:outer membrane beta-barrel protein
LTPPRGPLYDPGAMPAARSLRRLLAAAVLLGLGLGAPLVLPAMAEAQCIDEAIRDELNARRRYRGVRERLFQKALRHEISVMGGVYAADLLSASYLLQGAYTFHVTEDLALEASFAYTETTSDLVRLIENDRGIALIRLDRPTFVYQGHLVWTLAYGKLRWFGDGITRFDFNVAIGGGLTDTQTSRGLTFSGGFGIKFFFGEWFSLRLDVRDQVLQQELLGESAIVNNVTVTLGMSAFIPFTF